ncbi:MAG TPA: sarcosine oxidase subunit gamma family protein [Rhabdaerophilum sp.]|nr:sarcosine oxidase subunit gamma family protein [Rhabdaerophilum sp.]
MPDTGTTILTGAPPLARFVLRADTATAAMAGGAYGLDMPAAINRGTSKGERGRPGARVALQLGPDEFWLIVPEVEGVEVRTALEAALAGRPHSLVDVSHRQVGFVLSGPEAMTLLASGCPLDFDLRAFPIGMATRSVFHKIEFMVWRMAVDVFRIEVARSFAPYFEAMIAEARHDLV